MKIHEIIRYFIISSTAAPAQGQAKKKKSKRKEKTRRNVGIKIVEMNVGEKTWALQVNSTG